MSGKTDEVKGRIKEAVGALIGNDKLREEGKTDQAVGKVKQVAEEAIDTVKEVFCSGAVAATIGAAAVGCKASLSLLVSVWHQCPVLFVVRDNSLTTKLTGH
jgi:uncharacterized protein YjbJ (UPF0337 family)